MTLLTHREVAKICNVRPETVLRWARAKHDRKIRCLKVGRAVMFTDEHVRDWLRRCER